MNPQILRRLTSLLALCVLAAAMPGPVAAQEEGPPEVPDTIRGYVVMPPGQSGDITADEFAAGSYGEHFDDQLAMYAALVTDDDVTEDELLSYFREFQFSPGAEVERSYQPTEGVTVYRDSFGVPHIYADSLEAAGFASGYVTAEDRLFQMDIFRRAARGDLSSFAGPGSDDSLVRRDIETRREGYTLEEITKMFDDLDDRFGAVGEKLQTGLQAYADGVNAYMDEVRMDPTRMPFEYQATGNLPPQHPEEWTPQDTLYIAVLQLRVFGETAGGELLNAGFYSHLVERLGKKKGRALYSDLLFQNDPKSPTSIPTSEANFQTQDLSDVNWGSVAIPDKAEQVARRERRRMAEREAFLESLGFKKQASNALLVSGSESKTGNPLLLGGPQVGHALPSFFMDISVHAPGIDFRGAAVPGTSALIPLGRGADYAWSLTTGYSDAVDVRAERLCEPDDKEPTLESNHYLFKGECREMESREETIQVNPTPTDPGTPRSETHTFYRTVHGPVFERVKVNGKPVALVKERFFWKKEVDSLPSFYRWNAEVDSLDDFADAAKDFTMSFNSFYADAEHIGYFHVGEYPVRAEGVHPSLPVWGTGKWEWKGRRSYAKQPKIIDPEQGWIANWNNKPAKGWDNQDGFKWGPVQRVQLLIDRMHELLDGPGKADISDIVDVIRDAATRDARGAYLGPLLVRKAKKLGEAQQTEQYRNALQIVQEWIAKGAHRANKDGDDEMDDGPALAIFDAWYANLVHRIFDDEIGENGYELMYDAPITNYNPVNGGGFWFDFSSYLRNLLDAKRRKAAFPWNLCNDISSQQKETCNPLVGAALLEALTDLTEAQGADMSQWTVPAENISFTDNASSATAGSVDDIPWQNRGSQNHIVEILRKAN
ncbi:MAG: penicillin acylase family protein [Actinomycetota bacterium]